MIAGTITQRQDHDLSFRPCEELLASSARPSIQLNLDEVHIWGWTLDGSQASVQTCISWLDTDERTRAARFVREEDRRRFVLAHGCLRALLSRYVGCPEESLQIGTNQCGKPVLVSQASALERIEFNLSHAQDRMLVGVAQAMELGVDLEQVRPDTDIIGLAGRFYSLEEQEVLSRLLPVDQREAFFHYWVAKEAVLKGRGIGIPSLKSCKITRDSSRSRASAAVDGESEGKSDWTVEWLPCEATWTAAVACRGDRWTARCMGAS